MNDLFDKILIFDLDDTLIDTQSIKEILFDFAAKLGCGAKQIQGIYQEMRDEGFVLEKYATVLSDIVNKKSEEILSQLRAEIVSKKEMLISKDTRDFLELCYNMGVKMHLLTFGAPTWQTEKMQMLGLDKYFREARSTDDEAAGKLDELRKIVGGGDGEQSVLFNDKLAELVSALERYPKMTAYLRPARLMDGKLLEEIDPALRQRIKVLPNFRSLLPEIYDGNKK